MTRPSVNGIPSPSATPSDRELYRCDLRRDLWRLLRLAEAHVLASYLTFPVITIAFGGNIPWWVYIVAPLIALVYLPLFGLVLVFTVAGGGSFLDVDWKAPAAPLAIYGALFVVSLSFVWWAHRSIATRRGNRGFK